MKILEIEFAKKLADHFNNQPKIAKQFETFFGILILAGIQFINIGDNTEYVPLFILTLIVSVFGGLLFVILQGLWRVVGQWYKDDE